MIFRGEHLRLRHPAWYVVVLCAAFAMLFIAACGDDDDDTNTSATPGNDQPGDVSVMGIWGATSLRSSNQ